MGYLSDWIRIMEDLPPIYLGDLDDDTLRIRLYPPVHGCMFTTDADKAEREAFIVHLKTITRQKLLRINYEKEERRKIFYRSCGVNI